jgi:hypothetical protein
VEFLVERLLPTEKRLSSTERVQRRKPSHRRAQSASLAEPQKGLPSVGKPTVGDELQLKISDRNMIVTLLHIPHNFVKNCHIIWVNRRAKKKTNALLIHTTT